MITYLIIIFVISDPYVHPHRPASPNSEKKDAVNAFKDLLTAAVFSIHLSFISHSFYQFIKINIILF